MSMITDAPLEETAVLQGSDALYLVLAGLLIQAMIWSDGRYGNSIVDGPG